MSKETQEKKPQPDNAFENPEADLSVKYTSAVKDFLANQSLYNKYDIQSLDVSGMNTDLLKQIKSGQVEPSRIDPIPGKQGALVGLHVLYEKGDTGGQNIDVYITGEAFEHLNDMISS